MSVSSPRKSTDSLESPQSPSFQRSANAYPFPQYASGQQSALASRYRPRQGSTASTVSINSVANSIGGSLDITTSRPKNAVIEAGQNSISSLLQPPIVRTGLVTPASAASSTFRAPTTRDIPPVTLTNIPHVDPSAFKDYLSRIAPLLDSFQRVRSENQANSHKADDRPRDSNGASSPLLARQDSSTSLLSPIGTPQPRRRSSAHTRRRPNEPTPLTTIPTVYFEDNFQLENPRIFDVVSEHAEIVKPPPGTATESQNGVPRPPRKSLATNAVLQEKLSWYMDTVEIHLINSISNASSSFFAALGSLRDLEHEAADSVTRIQKLRRDLAHLDQNMAMGGLEVANLRRRHDNVRKLGRAVEQVAQVVDDARHCENLVEKGQYDAASSAMFRLERLIAGRPDDDNVHVDDGEHDKDERGKRIDLRSLKALQGFSDGLNHLQLRISKGFETRFLDALLSDLRHHVDKVPPNHTLRRWASTFQRQRGEARVQPAPPAYSESTADLRQNLLASLNGLTGSGQTARATAAFRDAVMKEMKNIIRKHLPSSNDDDVKSVTSVSTRGGGQSSQQDKSAILARNLRALDEDAAEELFTNIYTNVSEALRRLSVQIKVLLDVTSTVHVPLPPQSPVNAGGRTSDGQRNGSRSPRPRSHSLQDEVNQALDLSSLLGQAVDIAQTQITRVLKVRTEQSVRMPQNPFLRYFMLNRLFADECEAISGRSGTVLKSIVSGQLTAFVHGRGETENLRIANTLDADQWDAKDFDDEHQSVLSRILQGMSSDPPAWSRASRIWEDTTSETANGTLVSTETSANGHSISDSATANKPQTRPAYVDETRYLLVTSAISLLRPLDEFLSLIASIPSISSVAVQALIDLLRTFNSRTSQLVLGAGATRIAGLKNITTKHLALASQALSFVVALVPYMREAVRRHLGAGANKTELLGEFDKVKRLYQDHQLGIHDKLVEIMTGRATAHVNAMKKIDFDAEATRGSTDSVSPYMETLTKETATLYRVLSRHLSEPDVASIIMQIFKNYKETWTRAFTDARVVTAGGKERLIKDAELFDARLGKIDGFGDVGRNVIDSVKAKDVSVSPSPEAGGQSAQVAPVAGE